MVDKVDDPSFATAVGLLMWEADEDGFFFNSRERGILDRFGFKGAFDKIKKIFKTFLP